MQEIAGVATPTSSHDHDANSIALLDHRHSGRPRLRTYDGDSTTDTGEPHNTVFGGN